jgi:hypothetical protein
VRVRLNAGEIVELCVDVLSTCVRGTYEGEEEDYYILRVQSPYEDAVVYVKKDYVVILKKVYQHTQAQLT